MRTRTVLSKHLLGGQLVVGKGFNCHRGAVHGAGFINSFRTV